MTCSPEYDLAWPGRRAHSVPQRARSAEGDTKADEIAALVREFMRRGRRKEDLP